MIGMMKYSVFSSLAVDKPWMPRMNQSLSGYTPEEHVERPGAAKRHERQAARQASRADSNLTNSKLGCQDLTEGQMPLGEARNALEIMRPWAPSCCFLSQDHPRTEPEEVAPSLLQSMDPVEELSKTLKGPMPLGQSGVFS